MISQTKAILFGAVFGALSLSAPASFAQDMDAVLKALDDALPGSLMHNPLEMDWQKRGSDLKTKVVKAEALPSGQAISARVKKRQEKPWDTVIGIEVEQGVKKGETVQVHFWARTKKPAAGKDTANIVLFVGRNAEPYDNILSEDITPGEEWKLMSVKGVAESDFKAGSIKAEYQLGKSSQTVEFGPIYVSTLGDETASSD